MDWEFIAISFVGSNALAQELGRLDPAHGEGVFVTQVVPFPHDDHGSRRRRLSSRPGGNCPGRGSRFRYPGGLSDRDASPSPALELCGRELNRDCFLGSLQRAEYIDLDGLRLHYGGNDNQGSDTVISDYDRL